MKKCPYCAEEIQEEAIKCKHCGEWLKEISVLDQEKKKGEGLYDHEIASHNSKSTHPSKLQGVEIGKEEAKSNRTVERDEKEQRIRKWGWGWIILFCVYELGAKKMFTVHTPIRLFLEIGGIFFTVGFYFYLRKIFIKKKTFGQRWWLAPLLAGIISFFTVTITIGFILGLLDIYKM